MTTDVYTLARFLFALSLLALAGCETPVVSRFPQATPDTFKLQPDKAVVILTTDFREVTSLRVIPTDGSVRFRRLDERYDPLEKDKADFAAEFSLAANWKGVAGQPDANRLPRVFQIDPGTYVIERISMGSNISSVPPGYMAAYDRVTMGSFSVKAGEVVHLGRLMVGLYWREGRLSLQVDNNIDQVKAHLQGPYAALLERMQTRLMSTEGGVSFGR